MHYRDSKINVKEQRRGKKKSASFPQVFEWYISIWIEIFIFMLKKRNGFWSEKTMIKSFLAASLFLSFQMEALIFFLNDSSSEKITKIRNEMREGRKIKGVEEKACLALWTNNKTKWEASLLLTNQTHFSVTKLFIQTTKPLHNLILWDMLSPFLQWDSVHCRNNCFPACLSLHTFSLLMAFGAHVPMKG